MLNLVDLAEEEDIYIYTIYIIMNIHIYMCMSSILRFNKRDKFEFLLIIIMKFFTSVVLQFKKIYLYIIFNRISNSYMYYTFMNNFHYYFLYNSIYRMMSN